MNLLRQEAIHQVNNLYKLSDDLHCRSRDLLSGLELDEIQVRLSDIKRIESHKLHVKQINKFKRDGVKVTHPLNSPSKKSSKKPRNRRFRRKIHITANPNNTVVNLSTVSLTEDETKVLSKGLNFCPTPSNIDNMKLEDDLNNFARTLRIKEYFGNKDREEDNEGDTATSNSEDEIIIPHFKKKSSWIPKPSKSATLEDVIDKIKSDVVHLASNKYSSFYNTTPDEKKAIQSLRNRHDIVIKPADKGSAVVIMDKANYIAEAERQLSDERFYKKLDYDPTSEFSSKIITALQTMHNDGHIDEDTIGYLKPVNAKPGRLYLLPKIHKVNNPGRPIVSANGHPTEKISEFVDFHLRCHVENLPSHIQDTTDYLRKMESMNPLPPETLLVTLDVTSLYTNIPHDDGIQSCREIWDSRNTLEPPTECLVQLLTLVLKCNNFTFNGDNYLQINGTAMGTKMAPSYANIFMGKLEKHIISSSLSKPLSWFRFIDDVDMKWIESQQKLDAFIRHANNAHQSIKFTYEISDSKISFLDTTTSIKDGVISTDLYCKPTDKHQYLSPQSCHPKHCTKSIPYSQALRVKRICSSEEAVTQRLQELRGFLIKRGYKKWDIDKGWQGCVSTQPRSIT
ncbi:uncharacterized protein LOC134694136 [Mytilus trossulus]|uniref:uncharacterized protein LOC134694136 n=1 Tax=Mytilus trossulus TaxID=6551 RepID=UPI0030055A56